MNDVEQYPALEIEEVAKDYDELVALHDLSLSFDHGELVALVGSNGAGKSTLMRLTAGLLEPTRGAIYVEGSIAGSIEARAALSYIGDQPALYNDISLDEHIEYVTRLHGLADRPHSADELVAMFDLTDRSDDLPAHFSRGMRQKTALVLGLLRPFSVLLIDEPFIGLDPSGQLALTELLQTFSRDGAVVMIATHQLAFLEHADRCVALHDGDLAYDGTVDLGKIRRFLD
jgi:ABC-type multidrug transport system ATPase subunit